MTGRELYWLGWVAVVWAFAASWWRSRSDASACGCTPVERMVMGIGLVTILATRADL